MTSPWGLGFGGMVDALALGCFEKNWELTMKEVTQILDIWLWQA
jgi:hypothetical protein